MVFLASFWIILFGPFGCPTSSFYDDRNLLLSLKLNFSFLGVVIFVSQTEIGLQIEIEIGFEIGNL